MNKIELKEHIAKEIQRLEKQVAQYTELTKPISPENAIGRVSRMDAINNKSVLENALRKAEERLHKLKEITDKIDDKNFGICRKCHQKIPLQRVMLRPESGLCVNCAN
ncbi:TraR/DksA C4-type zinc finger protein [Psychroflexus sp. CAK8W]|uniref:TraR/DksA C4-type zinc finger protein n=1 Tax=Psychroflexus longus TaxID=2873596 RepID=A0ABS7XKN4_9FLAO|nr:TraR/DksA C4-type zinc finger protein [Psychroflexus longus]MBZ9778517.1 TraR/DksA C4-type zinc finger protein [Psychroflexus longus]